MNMKRKVLQFLTVVVAALVIRFGAADVTVTAGTSQFKGVNWADARDNFVNGVLYVSGLSSSDTYQSASAVADKVVGTFVTQLGANSVRMPINEPTVSNYWGTYTGAIDKALTKGKVILCYWGPSHQGGPADMNKYWNMWSTVVNRYGKNSNCYFEVFNEPHMYSATDLCNLYYNFLTRFPSVPRERIILDGAGLAQAITPVGNDSRLNNCLLAVHDYTMFVGNPSAMSEADWEKHISDSVGRFADRTICTEWGAPMSPGSKNGVQYGYQNYNSTSGSYFVPYVRGISSKLRKWNMGSFYWPGLRDGDWYSLMKKTGSGTNISLTVNNQSGLDRIHYAWGNGATPTPSTAPATASLKDGWYYIKNLNAQKYLQVAGDLGKSAQNIEIRTGSGKEGQKWYVKNMDNGYITLKSALGEFLVDVNREENTDGANIQIYNAHYKDAQQFKIQSTETNGVYVIATKISGLTKVLDAAGYKTEDGTNVCQWTYGGRNNQKWIFEAIPQSQPEVTPSSPQPSAPVIEPTEKLSVDSTANSWGTGYQVSFKITNKSDRDVTDWTLKLKKSEITITSSWNVTLTETASEYVITPVEWNKTITKGNSIEFGIQGSGVLANPLSKVIIA